MADPFTYRIHCSRRADQGQILTTPQNFILAGAGFDGPGSRHDLVLGGAHCQISCKFLTLGRPKQPSTALMQGTPSLTHMIVRKRSAL